MKTGFVGAGFCFLARFLLVTPFEPLQQKPARTINGKA
jgi:hypothetical protein